MTRARTAATVAKMAAPSSRTLALALTLAAAACEGDEAVLLVPECRCANPGCSPTACGFELRIAGPQSGAGSCAEEFSFAELEIDGYLEEAILIPGSGPVVPCTRVEPGDTAKVSVRGGTWVWQVSHTCDPLNDPVKPLTFECRALVAESEETTSQP